MLIEVPTATEPHDGNHCESDVDYLIFQLQALK